MPLGPNSITYARRTVTADVTLDATDCIVLVDAALGPITITLPLASGDSLFVVIIKKDVSVNVVTVARQSTNTIQGATSRLLSLIYDKVTLVAGGDGVWYNIASNII